MEVYTITKFLRDTQNLMTSLKEKNEDYLKAFQDEVVFKLRKIKFEEDLYGNILQHELKDIISQMYKTIDLIKTLSAKDICDILLENSKYEIYKPPFGFYRVLRYFDGFTPEAMCHNLKENTSENRYNKKGQPCCYLSEHAKLAWIEANKPEHFYIANFEIEGKFLFVQSPKQFIEENALDIAGRKKKDISKKIIHYLNCLPIYFMMSLPDRTNNGYQIPQLVIEYLTENVSDFGGILYKNCASYEIKFEGAKDPVKFDKYNLAILARNDFEGRYSRYIKNILKIDKKQKIDLVDIRGKSENLIDKEFKKIGIYI